MTSNGIRSSSLLTSLTATPINRSRPVPLNIESGGGGDGGHYGCGRGVGDAIKTTGGVRCPVEKVR